MMALLVVPQRLLMGVRIEQSNTIQIIQYREKYQSCLTVL
jgi:hypothetical protein